MTTAFFLALFVACLPLLILAWIFGTKESDLQAECERLRERNNVEHGAFVAMTEERDQLRAERDELRKALERISGLVETGQGCSANNHTIAVICLDIL